MADPMEHDDAPDTETRRPRYRIASMLSGDYTLAPEFVPTEVLVDSGDQRLIHHYATRGALDVDAEQPEPSSTVPGYLTEHELTQTRVECVVQNKSIKRTRHRAEAGGFRRRNAANELGDLADEVFFCAHCQQVALEVDAIPTQDLFIIYPQLQVAFMDEHWQFDTVQCVYSRACEIIGLQLKDAHLSFRVLLDSAFPNCNALEFEYFPRPELLPGEEEAETPLDLAALPAFLRNHGAQPGIDIGNHVFQQLQSQAEEEQADQLYLAYEAEQQALMAGLCSDAVDYSFLQQQQESWRPE